MPAARKVPRPFAMHWGSGDIVEEASFEAEHHEPAIQLLEYTDEQTRGNFSVRFCFYSRRGAFQRSPMMLGPQEIDGLREALRGTPRLREILKQLLD